MTEKKINLVTEFTDAPGGRSRLLGPHSGEEFREDVLRPALASFDVVEVNLDGALGLPSSFLDEAFGAFKKEACNGKLKVILTDNAVAKKILEDCLRLKNAA